MTKLQKFLNSPVSGAIQGRNVVKAGDLFGIELECEGTRVDWCRFDGEILKHWAPEHDGSLRNHHGAACEWIFKGPVNYKGSVTRVNKLFDYFEKRKAKFVCSNRTSTHVHFNMGDKNCYQVVNLFILFTILEGILDAYCGEDRVGNLFCLSSRHAEQQVDWVHDACFKHGHFGNFRDANRYCSLNLASLNKFGTVEFRAMRGLDNREDMLSWLSILNDFTQYACYTVKNPVDLLQEISLDRPEGFIRKVFSEENYNKLTKDLEEGFLDASIYEGLRMVQMLCYKIGTEFDQVLVKGPDFWASLSEDPVFPEVDIEEETAAALQRVGHGEQARAPRRPAAGRLFERVAPAAPLPHLEPILDAEQLRVQEERIRQLLAHQRDARGD